MSEIIRSLAVMARVAWQQRRDEAGGVTDSMVLIAVLVGLAVTAAGVLVAYVSGEIAKIPGSG